MSHYHLQQNALSNELRCARTVLSRIMLMESYRWLKNTACAPESAASSLSPEMESNARRTTRRDPICANCPASSPTVCLVHQRVWRLQTW